MRKTYDSKFKSRVALEAMRGELTIAEIASKYQVHPNQVQSWKKRLQEGATEIFMNASERKAENQPSDNPTHLHLSNQEICPTNGVRCIRSDCYNTF